MAPARPDTVLGDFDSATFEQDGVPLTFTRRGEEFVVTAEDANGQRRDFPVRFTFGAVPLQQYLLEVDAGRYQALTVAWDTRPAERGGQRWFDLYPDEAITRTDPLHWTSVLHNWNSSCAECHSTDLDKNFDPATRAFATTWSSVNVDCEACHGPGSLHVASPTQAPLVLGAVARAWAFDGGAPIAQRVPQEHDGGEIEVCAQCHSRRSQLDDRYEPGAAFLDSFRPALLSADLYHADGQILGEVFEHGSFLQSRMHAAGVTCSDCHDAHSGELRAQGNALCAQCHLPTAFDTPEHHRHSQGGEGSTCVGCHMRERTYMVVDPRSDHSFRVPRPDLSVTLGTPNACNGCHDDRSAEWAAQTVAEWFPSGRSGTFHYAAALHAGREWTAERNRLLTRVIDDREVPAIVRATAIELLARQLDDGGIAVLERVLGGDEPLVQLAALDALPSVPPALRVRLAQRFLTESPQALRIAAARGLLPVRNELSEARRADLDAALAEYVAVQRFSAERVEGLMNLGGLQAERGELDAAAASYAQALDVDAETTVAYVNLADLERQRGREAEAERWLRTGLARSPTDPALALGLGLSLVRSGRAEEALAMLRQASESGGGDPYYRYVYGVALHSSGERAAALDVLRATHERFPGHAPTLVALATMSRDAGDLERARDYAQRLLDLSPADPTARALLAELAGPARR
jgi:predicted CXXCH cytochrome family protein